MVNWFGNWEDTGLRHLFGLLNKFKHWQVLLKADFKIKLEFFFIKYDQLYQINELIGFFFFAPEIYFRSFYYTTFQLYNAAYIFSHLIHAYLLCFSL